MYEKLIAKMQAIVDRPGSPFLQAYRSDFEIDKQTLKCRYSETARFLWLLRRHGSDLVQIRVDPKMNDWAHAVLGGNFDGNLGIFLLAGDNVKPITRGQAMDELASYDYQMMDQSVLRGSVVLGHIAIEYSRGEDGRSEGAVSITSTRGNARIARDDLVAVISIAECEIIRRAQSLFARPKQVLIDGQDAYDLLSQKAPADDRWIGGTVYAAGEVA